MLNARYWRRWVLHCTFGELMGIGLAAAMVYVINVTIGEPASSGSKILILSLMMIVGLSEGSLLGYFQWRVLRDRFGKISAYEWILNTAIVAMMGWCLGMLPSLFFREWPSTNTAYEAGSVFDQQYLFVLLCLGVGLVLGAVFGVFQWLVLRKYVVDASTWIMANALGWSVALTWIYVFASIPTHQSSLVFIMVMGAVGGVFSGISLGAITGWYLVRLQ